MYNADPQRFRPLSPIAYIYYGILFLIPVVGLVCAIVFARRSHNVNLRCYSRAFLIAFAALVVIISVAALVLFSRGQLSAVIRRIPSAFKVLFP